MLLAQTIPWRPFLDPLDMHEQWWIFLIPLSLGIAVAYRAVRLPTLEGFVRSVLMMTLQIVAAMILLGLFMFLFVEHLMPLLVPMTE